MTDDRRALAERLAREVYDDYCNRGRGNEFSPLDEQMKDDREPAILCVLAGLSHRDPHVEREAAKQAWDAAVRCTGVTSSYASARDRYLAATYPTEPPRVTLSDGSVVTRRISGGAWSWVREKMPNARFKDVQFWQDLLDDTDTIGDQKKVAALASPAPEGRADVTPDGDALKRERDAAWIAYRNAWYGQAEHPVLERAWERFTVARRAYESFLKEMPHA